MIQTMTGIFLSMLHFICCILIYLGIRLQRLKVEKFLMPFVVMIPLWGPLCVLILHFQLVGQKYTREIGLDKMRIKEEIYKSILMENADTAKHVVPLEEALLINVPELRRELMMEMLNDNPQEYMQLLNQAKMNQDVEVVHYAATAIAEVLKEYDFQLQKLEQTYDANPKDGKALEAYCEFLQMYIEQGMVQGQMEIVQRNQYAQLLNRQLECKKELGICIRLTDNYLQLGDYTKASETLKIMEQYWPERQEYWMLKIRYFVQQRQGKALSQLIQEIEDRQIYLSAQNKQTLDFWKQKKSLPTAGNADRR